MQSQANIYTEGIFMKVYLYGMIACSNSFLLKEFVKPDKYTEIEESHRFPGGETGTCATVLSSLGAQVLLDGNHIGKNCSDLVRDFYGKRSVDISLLHFDPASDSPEDYVLISGSDRTPLGNFGHFFSAAYASKTRPWNKPDEKVISECDAAAIDPFFWEDSELAAKYCVKHGVPYVTIDCMYDSFIHKHSAVSVISGEGIDNNYPDKTREELTELFIENGGGLSVITNGGRELFYGRKGEKAKTFTPFKVNVKSTLGAGDSFKAGCTYAAAAGMGDGELIEFASACAAAAISKYPLQLDPPTIREVYAVIEQRK